MRRLAIAAVLLASCTLATAQDIPGRSDTPPAQGGNWWTRMWGSSDKPASTKSATTDKKASALSAIEAANRTRVREEAVLNRRNEVILKLREIALRNEDNALLRKADELQEQAWDLYMRNTSGLASPIKEERR